MLLLRYDFYWDSDVCWLNFLIDKDVIINLLLRQVCWVVNSYALQCTVCYLTLLDGMLLLRHDNTETVFLVFNLFLCDNDIIIKP